MAENSELERDTLAMEELLRELIEVRELDQVRHAHAPGSADADKATREIDSRSRRLMDRFRDVAVRAAPGSKATPGD